MQAVAFTVLKVYQVFNPKDNAGSSKLKVDTAMAAASCGCCCCVLGAGIVLGDFWLATVATDGLGIVGLLALGATACFGLVFVTLVEDAKEKGKFDGHAEPCCWACLCTMLMVLPIGMFTMDSDSDHIDVCFFDDLSAYPDSYVLSGCEVASHCGTYVKTKSNCDCAPIYQVGGYSEGNALYRSREEPSRWYVAPGSASCGSSKSTFAASGSNAQATDPLAAGYLDAGGWVEWTGNDTAFDGWESVESDHDRFDDVVHGRIAITVGASADICAAHGTWDADDEVCVCSGNYIGVLCTVECSCGEHGTYQEIGTAWEADSCAAGSCLCSGNYIGALCNVECSCGAHGTQQGIAAAREADSCAGGSCACDPGYFGETCSSASATVG